jgi:hypothetical protein
VIKATAKAIMEEKRQARREAQCRWRQGMTSSRRSAVLAEKQVMLKERQDKYLKELVIKHELQQQEGRYVKAPRYLHAASKEYADHRYLKDAAEKAIEMIQAPLALVPCRSGGRPHRTDRRATSCPGDGRRS